MTRKIPNGLLATAFSMSFRLIGVVAVVMTIGSMFLIPQVARIFVGYDAELLELTDSALRKLGRITDEQFVELELVPDLD